MSEKPSGGEDQGKPSRTVEPVKAPRAAGGLRLYKPTQGYYTRVGTAIGAGILVVAGAAFIFGELSAYIDPSTSYALPLKYGVSVGFILLMGGLLYWVVGLNRTANDFFIATEGEMKKVNWSSRAEIVRSTKVVIFCVIVLSVFLFAADLLFMGLFTLLGVLQAGAGFQRLFGSGS